MSTILEKYSENWVAGKLGDEISYFLLLTFIYFIAITLGFLLIGIREKRLYIDKLQNKPVAETFRTFSEIFSFIFWEESDIDIISKNYKSKAIEMN